LHPDTANYLSRVAAAGGTVSTANQTALDTAIKAIYANNLRGSTNFLKYFLCFILTSSFDGCLVPVFDDGVGNPTNNNFVAGDWNSLGLKGNGTNKSLNSNFNLATQLGTFSTGGRSDVHLGAWVSEYTPLFLGAFNYFMGAQIVGTALADTYAISYTDGSSPTQSEFYYASGRNVISIGYISKTGFPTGFYLGNTPSRDNVKFSLNGTIEDDNTGTVTTIRNPAQPMFLYARRAPAGAAQEHTPARIKLFTMGYGLSTVQETALYTILNTLIIALGA
jgi:hypothetical protein